MNIQKNHLAKLRVLFESVVNKDNENVQNVLRKILN